jgi:hypothetical protein
MRRALLVTTLSAVAIGGWVLGGAASGSAATNHDYERVADFDHQGYTIHCDSSPCPVPIFSGVPFDFQTLGASYDAVVTMSFTYQTTAGTRVSVVPLVGADGVAMTPTDAQRYLPPAAKARSTTVTWLIPSLTAGQGYRVALVATPAGSSPPYSIRVSDITTVIEGAPA